jgi:hypothetical protein
MHQEPRPTQPPIEPREDVKARKHRFQITKLEERIAAACLYHQNPQGKWVGRYTRDCWQGRF